MDEVRKRLVGYYVRAIGYDTATKDLTFERAMAPDQAGHHFVRSLDPTTAPPVLPWPDINDFDLSHGDPQPGQLGWLWEEECRQGEPFGTNCTTHSTPPPPPSACPQWLEGPDRWMSKRGYYAYEAYVTAVDQTQTQVTVVVPGELDPIIIPDWCNPYFVWPHHPFVIGVPQVGQFGWILFGPGLESRFQGWTDGYKYPMNAAQTGNRTGCTIVIEKNAAGGYPYHSDTLGQAFRRCRLRGRIIDQVTGRLYRRTTAPGKYTVTHPLALGNGRLFDLPPDPSTGRRMSLDGMAKFISGLKAGDKIQGASISNFGIKHLNLY